MSEKSQELEKSINVFFLHGAFHIFAHTSTNLDTFIDQYLFKICSKRNPSFNENLLEEWETLERKLEDYFIGKSRYPDIVPTIIMEDRPSIKISLIKRFRYLKEGLDKLQNAQKIFTFGCSFTYDEHLLKSIFSCNGTRKSIALGHYGEEEKKKFRSYIQRYDLREHHEIFPIETKGYANHIWVDKP